MKKRINFTIEETKLKELDYMADIMGLDRSSFISYMISVRWDEMLALDRELAIKAQEVIYKN